MTDHIWRAAFAGAFLTVWIAPAFAHGGGLNSEGCHNNRKTGDYHCHRSFSPPPPPPPRYDAQDSGLRSSFSADSEQDEASANFRNCSDARAAGAAPVRAGDPGYGRHLDRDGDGVGCE
jgi:hypothetical protein